MKYPAMLALAATLVAAAQPALAANRDLDFAASGERRSGAFVGTYFRLPLNGTVREAAEPRAGLRLSLTQSYRDVRAVSGGRFYEAEMADLNFAPDEKASLRLAGQEVAGPVERLGYDDAEDGRKRGKFKWWIPAAIVGGAAIGVLGFFAYVKHQEKHGCCE